MKNIIKFILGFFGPSWAQSFGFILTIPIAIVICFMIVIDEFKDYLKDKDQTLKTFFKNVWWEIKITFLMKSEE